MSNDSTTDEAAIRGVIESWAAAVRRKDMPGILRNHAADIAMFDVPPPLVSRGIAAYQQTWAPFYAASPDPPPFDIREIEITVGGEVAFAVALMRCALATPAGGADDLDFRLTIGLRKVARQWTVLHEHHSVPAT